jgi:hypothetical protein
MKSKGIKRGKGGIDRREQGITLALFSGSLSGATSRFPVN